jgi:hypothetical protein
MREIVFHADGRLEEVEDESEIGSFPAPARAAIQKAVTSANGVLRKVDIIRRGSTVLYEGEYRIGEVKKKIIVDARGATVEAR